jgi:hypothetical protein
MSVRELPMREKAAYEEITPPLLQIHKEAAVRVSPSPPSPESGTGFKINHNSDVCLNNFLASIKKMQRIIILP